MLKKTFCLLLILGFSLGLRLVAPPRAKADTTYNETMRSGAFLCLWVVLLLSFTIVEMRDGAILTQGDCARSIFFTFFSAAIYTVGIAGMKSGRF